jgi:hypothetical protein
MSTHKFSNLDNFFYNLQKLLQKNISNKTFPILDLKVTLLDVKLESNLRRHFILTVFFAVTKKLSICHLATLHLFRVATSLDMPVQLERAYFDASICKNVLQSSMKNL